jgi:hypothetical protein
MVGDRVQEAADTEQVPFCPSQGPTMPSPLSENEPQGTLFRASGSHCLPNRVNNCPLHTILANYAYEHTSESGGCWPQGRVD